MSQVKSREEACGTSTGQEGVIPSERRFVPVRTESDVVTPRLPWSDKGRDREIGPSQAHWDLAVLGV